MHIENYRNLNSKSTLIDLFSYLLDHFSYEEISCFFDISKNDQTLPTALPSICIGFEIRS